MFCEGRGLNCSYAVYQDASGKAEEKTIALGIGIGAGYLFKTTFQREATSDLTGERGSLMGAIEGLLEAQYDVLRENGHSPSEAFNETVEELTQSLGPLFGAKGMDWMYANCSTTAQRGALDWAPRFREAIKPVMEWLYYSVKTGNEAQISIDKNSQADYREKLNAELEAMRNKEMWQAGVTVRKLRITNFFLVHNVIKGAVRDGSLPFTYMIKPKGGCFSYHPFGFQSSFYLFNHPFVFL